MTHGLTDQLSDKVKPSIRRWRRRRKLMTMATAATLGAAASYLLDPEHGSERRARARARWARRTSIGAEDLVRPGPPRERTDMDDIVPTTGAGATYPTG